MLISRINADSGSFGAVGSVNSGNGNGDTVGKCIDLSQKNVRKLEQKVKHGSDAHPRMECRQCEVESLESASIAASTS